MPDAPPSERIPQDDASRRILEERARQAARVLESPPSGERVPYIAFRPGGEALFGIPYAAIEEIMPCAEIARIPCTPAVIAGVTNYRGELLTVLDMRRIVLPPGDFPPCGSEGRVIVVSAGGCRAGLMVECVEDNDEYGPDELAPIPGEAHPYVLGVHRGSTALLKVEVMLGDPALRVEERTE